MVATVELGYRNGKARARTTSDVSREHINGIQATFLGILALLLGFTLSLALQRFDSRSEAEILADAQARIARLGGAEYLRANPIGTGAPPPPGEAPGSSQLLAPVRK